MQQMLLARCLTRLLHATKKRVEQSGQQHLSHKRVIVAARVRWRTACCRSALIFAGATWPPSPSRCTDIHTCPINPLSSYHAECGKAKHQHHHRCCNCVDQVRRRQAVCVQQQDRKEERCLEGYQGLGGMQRFKAPLFHWAH